MKKIFFQSILAGLLAIGAAGVASADTLVYSNADLGEQGNTPVTINLTGLAAHSTVTLNFDLYILDSWDGEDGGYSPDYFGFTVNGTEYKWSFDNFGGTESNTVTASSVGNFNVQNNWGAIDRYFKDYAGGFTVADVSSDLEIVFFASGSGYQGGCDETWQVTNLSVSTNNSPVPEPTTMLLFGAGAAGLTGFARRKRS